MSLPQWALQILKKALHGSGSGAQGDFFSGMHDEENVVIRCYFNNKFILMIMILMNKVVRYILFVYLCRYTSIGNIYGY